MAFSRRHVLPSSLANKTASAALPSALLASRRNSLTFLNHHTQQSIMSDAFREDLTSKAQREAKPSSQETMGDKATGAYESAASTLEPQSAKGQRQAAADETTESHTHGPEASRSMGDKVKHALHMDK
ncbi:hypothetical protein JCM10213v2_005192 [Rhodosporidiobolus nylandii]